MHDGGVSGADRHHRSANPCGEPEKPPAGLDIVSKFLQKRDILVRKTFCPPINHASLQYSGYRMRLAQICPYAVTVPEANIVITFK